MYRFVFLTFLSIFSSSSCFNVDRSEGPDAEIPNIQCNDSNTAPRPCGPYCSAARVNNTLYLSGVIGIDKKTKKLADGGVKHETEVVFKNIKSILEEFGSSLEKVVNVRVYLDDLDNMKAVNDLYATFFLHPFPARTLVEVSKLPEDAKIEVEVMALLDGPGRYINPQTDMSFKH